MQVRAACSHPRGWDVKAAAAFQCHLCASLHCRELELLCLVSLFSTLTATMKKHRISYSKKGAVALTELCESAGPCTEGMLSWCKLLPCILAPATHTVACFRSTGPRLRHFRIQNCMSVVSKRAGNVRKITTSQLSTWVSDCSLPIVRAQRDYSARRAPPPRPGSAPTWRPPASAVGTKMAAAVREEDFVALQSLLKVRGRRRNAVLGPAGGGLPPAGPRLSTSRFTPRQAPSKDAVRQLCQECFSCPPGRLSPLAQRACPAIASSPEEAAQVRAGARDPPRLLGPAAGRARRDAVEPCGALSPLLSRSWCPPCTASHGTSCSAA